MIAVVNDVSFQYQYPTAEKAVQSVHEFLNLCVRVQRDEITKIDRIETGVIDTQVEIAPNYRLMKLIQEFSEREERLFLISLLTNRGTYQTEDGYEVEIDGKISQICKKGIDNFLVSLKSTKIFEEPVVYGSIENKRMKLRNLAGDDHIHLYRKELGVRHYIPNDKKHKPDRENSYGKGKVGSRMDLNDADASELLNKAIYVGERLYGKKDGTYYAFQHEGDVNYHGYRADDLEENIKRQLDLVFGNR